MTIKSQAVKVGKPEFSTGRHFIFSRSTFRPDSYQGIFLLREPFMYKITQGPSCFTEHQTELLKEYFQKKEDERQKLIQDMEKIYRELGPMPEPKIYVWDDEKDQLVEIKPNQLPH